MSALLRRCDSKTGHRKAMSIAASGGDQMSINRQVRNAAQPASCTDPQVEIKKPETVSVSG